MTKQRILYNCFWAQKVLLQSKKCGSLGNRVSWNLNSHLLGLPWKKTSWWDFNFHEQLFPRDIPENKFIVSSACTFFYFKKYWWQLWVLQLHSKLLDSRWQYSSRKKTFINCRQPQKRKKLACCCLYYYTTPFPTGAINQLLRGYISVLCIPIK